MRILTNSLEATDVLPVQSGYARRRAELLGAGVSLHELRLAAGQTAQKYYSVGMFGSYGSSLQAKTLFVDARRAFAGSLNFDPPSANLNKELGFVIDSLELTARIESALWKLAPNLAYEVRLIFDYQSTKLAFVAASDVWQSYCVRVSRIQRSVPERKYRQNRKICLAITPLG